MTKIAAHTTEHADETTGNPRTHHIHKSLNVQALNSNLENVKLGINIC